MCFICSCLNPYAEKCEYEDLPDPVAFDLAAFLENTGDAPNGTSTTYAMSVGDTFEGTIASLGDRDWIALNVTAGQSYNISVNGVGAVGTALPDSYLRLYDSGGSYIGFDDDGGPGYNSHIWYTATTTGTVYLSVAGWGDQETGDYQVSVTSAAGRTTFTTDQIADQLTDGYWTSPTSERTERKFDASVGDTITVDITGLTAEGQQLAQWAFAAWTDVSGLQFSFVSDPNAQIIVDDNDSGAYNSSTVAFDATDNAYYITQSVINVSTAWIATYGSSIDSYSMQTYLHEIGHAIGLGHAGNYNGAATWNIDNEYLNDVWNMTLMSYFSPNENPNVSYSNAYTVTPMMADIVAVQNLYGSNVVHNPGDTVYGYNSTLTDYLGQLFGQQTGEDTADTSLFRGFFYTLALFDTGGTDTIDMSGSSATQMVDMNDETISSFNGTSGTLSIARGTLIENYIGGSGQDTVTGNEAANNIAGNTGSDSVDGMAGNDTLSGGFGADTLKGGDDNDSISGGDHNDSLEGGSGSDEMDGDGGADTLVGGSGNDTLDGGGGADSLVGGDDDDLFENLTDGDTVEGGDGGTDMDVLDPGTSNFTISNQTNDPDGNSTSGTLTILDTSGGNDTVISFSEIETIMCFAPGTQITTPEGSAAVETLAEGDMLRTATGADVPVRWIGRQTVTRKASGFGTEPVLITKGALGQGLPLADLTVTADHGMVLEGYVINASALVNGQSIRFVPHADLPERLTFYHIETAAHDVILANGAAAETFVDAEIRSGFDNYQEYEARFGAGPEAAEMDLLRITSRRLVPASVRARLAAATAQRRSSHAA